MRAAHPKRLACAPFTLQAADVLLAVERWGRWRQPQHAPQLLVYDIGALC